jgi:hypothetical protein
MNLCRITNSHGGREASDEERIISAAYKMPKRYSSLCFNKSTTLIVKAPLCLKYDNPFLPPVTSPLKDESKEDGLVSIDESHQNELDDIRIEESDSLLIL